MIRNFMQCLMVAACAAMLGCGGRSASTRVPERFPPEQAAEIALERYDADSDGKISGAELDEVPALKVAMGRLDTDGDKAVSADEIISRLQKYEEQSLLVAVTVQVISNGRPLEGATLRMEPEPFMGEDLETYVVTTGDMGSGIPHIAETGEMKTALPLGFYRVTISHPDHPGEVVRGCEIADDVPSANRLLFSMQEESPQASGRYSGR